jgi:hypothetical protein
MSQIGTLRTAYRLLNTPSTADTLAAVALLATLAVPLVLKIRQARRVDLRRRAEERRAAAAANGDRPMSLDEFVHHHE